MKLPRIFLLPFLFFALSGNCLIAEEAKPVAVEKKKEVSPKAGKPDSGKKEAEPEKKADAKVAEKPEGKPEGKADAKASSPEIHRAERGEITVTEKIPGILQSTKSTPLAMDLLQWADLLVVKAVPHGAEVKKGDLLVDLDTKAIREKIEELELGMPTVRLELEAAELNFEKVKKSTPLALEKARRNKMQAEQDLAYFEDVTLPMREKGAAQDVKQVKDFLAYAEEELKQLRKMYEADDLTEETEEIIIRRAENSVNEYRWRLEQTEERSKRSVHTLLPRELEELRRARTEAEISWRAEEKSLPDALKKAELEFQAKARALVEAETSLEEHRRDLEALTVRAPHDGVVYYGMSQRGKWTTASTVERKLLPGGKLTMREIFMTVVDPAALELLLAIPEDKLADLAPGQAVEVEAVASPETEIAGELTSISRVPYPDNTFDGIVRLSEWEGAGPLFPGMKAEAEVTVYENADALLLPSGAVKKEDEKETVTLKGGVVRVVETGRAAGGKVEILKGLKPGDEVILPGKEADGASEKTDAKEEKK